MYTSLGNYFAPSYFGGLAPLFQDATAIEPDLPVDIDHGDTGILQWVFQQIRQTGWFEQVTLGRNPGPNSPGRQPLCWIYPVGFNERNDANDFAIRQTTVNVLIAVDCDRDGDPLAAYRQLEELAALVVDQVETGPDWVDPSPGGLLSGRYDPPPNRGSSNSGAALDRIDLQLTFAYSWGRDK